MRRRPRMLIARYFPARPQWHRVAACLGTILEYAPNNFLTGKGDIQTSVDAMKAGAVDFLTKSIDSVRLFAAIKQAFQRDEERRLQASIRRVVRQRFDTLTSRERQVMALVIRGRLNKEIAAELGTGEKTVKVHRARVMSKMLARPVPELVQLGARVGAEMQPSLGIGSSAFKLLSRACGRRFDVSLPQEVGPQRFVDR